MNEVNESGTHLLVKRQKGKPVVVMSLQEYKSYEERAYLMASPKSAVRLSQAILVIEQSLTLNTTRESMCVS